MVLVFLNTIYLFFLQRHVLSTNALEIIAFWQVATESASFRSHPDSAFLVASQTRYNIVGQRMLVIGFREIGDIEIRLILLLHEKTVPFAGHPNRSLLILHDIIDTGH